MLRWWKTRIRWDGECESCAANREHRPAVTRRRRPEGGDLVLCAECAADHDRAAEVGGAVGREPARSERAGERS